jgi:hypothetical protein
MDFFFTGRLSPEQYQNHRNTATFSIKNQTNKAIKVNKNIIKGFSSGYI